MKPIREVLYPARKDLAHMFSSPETWLWAFLMPVVFFYFIGTITGRRAGTAARETLAMLVPADAGFFTDHLQRRLERHDRVVRAPDEAALGRFRRQLRVPADFAAQVLAGR